MIRNNVARQTHKYQFYQSKLVHQPLELILVKIEHVTAQLIDINSLQP